MHNVRPFLPQPTVTDPHPHLTFTTFLRHWPKELMVMGFLVLSVSEETLPLLVTQFCTGNRLCAVGNGTVKDGIGAHRWQLRPFLDLSTNNRIAESAAQSDGHSVTITSFWTKSLAVLAIMYHERALSQHYSIPVLQSHIQYFFDNGEALRRLITLDSFSDTANPLSTDYDF